MYVSGGFVGYGWISCWRQAPNFQPFNGSNFWTTCLNWINNPNIQPHSILLDVFRIRTGHHGWSVCRSLKKLKNERSAMFRGSAIQTLEEILFSVRIWIIIKKIYLHQQKMNGNDAIIYWYFERTTH